MTAKLRRRRREHLEIPFELDITMDEILDDLFHPNPWRAELDRPLAREHVGPGRPT